MNDGITMIINEEDYLEHFGVKGMKWGVRRARKKYSNKSMRQYKANERNAKSLKRDLDSNHDSVTGSSLDSQTRTAYQHEYDRAVETGRQWLQTLQDIQKMTTVSDIKKRYENTARKNVYYTFA